MFQKVFCVQEKMFKEVRGRLEDELLSGRVLDIDLMHNDRH